MVEEIEKKLGIMGRMISGSKSGYRNRHPVNFVVFNANICVYDENNTPSKIWFGDIDLTLDRDVLRTLAIDLNMDLYILQEFDARFSNEENPIIKNFVYLAKSNGQEELGRIAKEYYHINDDNKLVKK